MADPVHKVTIIPRGMALGITWSLPDEDRHSRTKNELLAQITMALSGRISEEIKFGDVTTGASNDFEKATELARRMVTQYGMSDSLGPIQYGRGNHQVFLGRDFGEDRNYSEEIAGKIDAEVRQIIETCYSDARQLLKDNWAKVERMVASLLEHETVDTDEVVAILNDLPYSGKPEDGGSQFPETRSSAARSGTAARKADAATPEYLSGARISRLHAAALGAAFLLTAGPAQASVATSDLPDLGAGVTVSHLVRGGMAIVRPSQGAPRCRGRVVVSRAVDRFRPESPARRSRV